MKNSNGSTPSYIALIWRRIVALSLRTLSSRTQNSQTWRIEVQKQLKADGVIERITPEWTLPVLFLLKKDGSFRLCIDYHHLYKATTNNTYQLPRIVEWIDSCGTVKLFNTLDANSGYWKISVNEEDRDKSAFVFHAGLYRYRQIPFWLINALAIFQRTLVVILSGSKRKTSLVYLEYVIAFPHLVREHFRHPAKTLRIPESTHVSLRLSKCKSSVLRTHTLETL